MAKSNCLIVYGPMEDNSISCKVSKKVAVCSVNIVVTLKIHFWRESLDKYSEFGRKRRAFFDLRRGFGQRYRPRGSGQYAARLLHRPDDAVCAQDVEPMAAVTAPAQTAAQHQSLLHFSARLRGRTRRCWRRCTRRCGRRWNAMARSRPGSSTTTPAFRRRASILSGWRGNIADSWASRTIARRRSRCRLPIARPACRCAIGFTCRKNGRTTRRADAGLTCLRRSSSRPSPRSPWSSYAGPIQGGTAARGGAARRGLWQSHQPAYADQCPWAELCCRHSVEQLDVGARHQAVATQAMVCSVEDGHRHGHVAAPSTSRSR